MISNDNIKRWQGYLIIAYLEIFSDVEQLEVRELELKSYKVKALRAMVTKGLAITLETDESDSRVRRFT